MKKLLKTGYSLLLIILFLIAGVTALSAAGLPKQFQIFVVQSGSMEPTINKGSLVIVQPQNTYQNSDIVTFITISRDNPQTLQTPITHRIIETKQTDKTTNFITKGDANNAPDMEERPFNALIGKVTIIIPYVGYLINFAKTKLGFFLFIIIPATIIIYSEIITLKNEFIKLIQEKKRRKLTPKEKVEEQIGEQIVTIEEKIKDII